jgi:signal transduction histidine kinase
MMSKMKRTRSDALPTAYQQTRGQIEFQISLEERQGLRHEIHDTLGQQITAIGLKAAKLHVQLAAESSPHEGQAGILLDMVDEAQRQVRSLLDGMLPVEFDASNVITALADLADKTHLRHEIDCRFDCDGLLAIQDNTVAMHLYRIAQEAVHNAVKHSSARHIVIRLYDRTNIKLEVRDDGAGIADKVGGHGKPSGATRHGAAGLKIMRYRAHLIGGKITIRPAEPNGTIVRFGFTIPRQRATT